MTEVAPNVTLAPNVCLEPCDHDWRVNPVVITTTNTGDCELWTCVRCRAQRTGPRLSVPSKHRVHPFDPTTWEHRGEGEPKIDERERGS